MRTVKLIKARKGLGDVKQFLFKNFTLGKDYSGLTLVGQAHIEVDQASTLESAASASVLIPQQPQAFVAISLLFQNGCGDSRYIK